MKRGGKRGHQYSRAQKGRALRRTRLWLGKRRNNRRGNTVPWKRGR